MLSGHLATTRWNRSEKDEKISILHYPKHKRVQILVIKKDASVLKGLWKSCDRQPALSMPGEKQLENCHIVWGRDQRSQKTTEKEVWWSGWNWGRSSRWGRGYCEWIYGSCFDKKTIETEDWDCRDWLESDSDTKKIPKQLMRSPVEEVIFSWRGVYKCWLKQESEEANKEIYNTTLNSTNGFKNLIEASNRIVSKTSQQKQKSYENVLFDVINKISQNIINIIQYNQKDLCKDLSKAFTYKIR